MKLQNMTAIVTGGSRGIGKAIALGLARAGANVVIVSRTLPDLQKVADEIEALGVRALSIKVDVTKSSEVNSMVQDVLREFKKIDILVNNAGGSARERCSLFCESTEDVWDYVINLNLKGVFICTRAVINHMIQMRRGKIVNISSTRGLSGQAGRADYSATKGGVIAFTRALAKEVVSHGINVNVVLPGATATEAMKWVRDSDKIGQFTGFGRLARPEEVASMVVFLCTDDAAFITGQDFPVCGLENIGTS